MMQFVGIVLMVLFRLAIFSHGKENQCPEGKASCSEDSTCCFLSNGSFGCCPIQNAVCCGDSVHCCPNGYTCDVIKGICKMDRKLVPLLKKIPAKPPKNKNVSDFKTKGEIICPDGFQCPGSSTCCSLSFGPHAFCPLPQAVCCSDQKHCCPEGYTCDMEAGKCHKTAEHIKMIENIPAIKTSIAGERIKGFHTIAAMLQNTSALETNTSAALNPARVVCPDGGWCPDGSTCCRARSIIRWKCCRYRFGVCCADRKHCCPAGSVCVDESRLCLRPRQSISVFHKEPAAKRKEKQIPAIKKSIDVELKHIHPDECSCFDNETCCELADGHFGCCPYSRAVCCSDHEHCCPPRFRCDLAAEMCDAGNVRLPMLKKAKSPRRPKIQKVNLDEKIHFVSAHANVRDPWTDDESLTRKSLKSEN